MKNTAKASDASKVISLKDLRLPAHKNTHRKTVLAGGCFDLFHYGHLYFLGKAKKAGDLLVVALEPDEFIIKTKKRTPVHTQEQRAAILSHIDIVDRIILLPLMRGYDDYLEMTKSVSPRIIAVTKGDPAIAFKRKQAEAVGAQIMEVDLIKEFSSSNIMRYAAVFGD